MHGISFELPTFPELVVIDSVGLSSEGEGISETAILAIFIFAVGVILALFSLDYAQIAHHQVLIRFWTEEDLSVSRQMRLFFLWCWAEQINSLARHPCLATFSKRCIVPILLRQGLELAAILMNRFFLIRRKACHDVGWFPGKHLFFGGGFSLGRRTRDVRGIKIEFGDFFFVRIKHYEYCL